MIRVCPRCGESFDAPNRNQRFCSRACWKESLVKQVERVCQRCGKTFQGKRDRIAAGGGKFCSRVCANTGWEEPCFICGKPVHRTPYHAARFSHVFCSRVCYAVFRLERITKICAQCGNPFTDKRSHMTRGRGIYCSQECYDVARGAKIVMFTCQFCGQEFTRQAGHISSDMYNGNYCSRECASEGRKLPDSARSIYNHEFTEELKEQIRRRDNRTCQICGTETSKTYRRLAVHHIDYDKTNNHPSNLIALCDSCHSRTNYDRDYWRFQLHPLMQSQH